MKIVKVIPLHKGGPSSVCDNQRPISLLQVLSKVIEKVIYYRTVSHIDKENILFNRQFGFRKKHSTVDAVEAFIGEVLEGMNTDYSVMAIFVDLKKAFYTVSHSIILQKLEQVGI